MHFWRRRKNRHETQVRELENQLLSLELSHLELPSTEQERIKNHLVMMLEDFPLEERVSSSVYQLQNKLRISASQPKLPQQVSLRVKERIMASIGRTTLLELAFGSRKSSYFLKEFLSVALLFCFVVTTVFFLPMQIPVTLAAHDTYVEQVSGKVSVLRNGKLYIVQKDFPLEEGDILRTEDKSLATIHFFDDSTSRLGFDTQLQLSRLHKEPFNPLVTHVEVLLHGGQVWTRVLNLVDDDSQFVLDTDQTRAVVNKKAAFDVEVLPSNDVLTVFDNVVGFSVKDDVGFQSKAVLAGFQAKVSHDQSLKSTTILPISDLDAGVTSRQEWFSSNLQQDKAHVEKLVVEKEGDLQANSDVKKDEVPVEKRLDNANIIANPEIERQRLYFLENYLLLQQGETLLVRNQSTEGLRLILQFQNVMRTFARKLTEFQKTDALNAALLRTFIETKIGEQRKDLATFLPGDPLYPAKEIMEDTALIFVENDIDRTMMRLTQAEDKLLEIQDMVTIGKLDQAEDILVRYKRQISVVVLKVDGGNLTQLKGKLTPLLHQQFSHIKVLTSIEKSLDEEQQKDFLLAVRQVRHDMVEKFIDTLEILPDAVPAYLVRELKDLLQIYLGSAVRDEEFIKTLNALLMLHGQQVNLNSPHSLPGKLGVVTIVDEQDADVDTQESGVDAAPTQELVQEESQEQTSVPVQTQELSLSQQTQ